jgi:uncharacterized RDD family membrane protein YckC
VSEPSNEIAVPETGQERSASARAGDLALGAAVTTARAGAAVARLALLPARMLLNAPIVAREARASEARMRATGQDVVERGRRTVEAAVQDLLASDAAKRAVDGALAGPLPEEIARSLADHRVLERLVESPAFEQALADALRTPAAHGLTDRVIASPELEQTIERVASSPAVRQAVTNQTKGFADEVAAGVHRRAAAADDRATRTARRLVGRAPADGPYAGLVARGLAFVLDVLILAGLTAAAGAIVALIDQLVELRPDWLAAFLVGGEGVVLTCAYFLLFWTVVGRTPGMHALRIRVVDRHGLPPGFGRALVRLVATVIAIVPLFAGFLPVLVDGRRRALADYLAGTTVVLAGEADAAAQPVDAAATAASMVG